MLTYSGVCGIIYYYNIFLGEIMTGCSVEGCTRKHEAHGLCKVHYNKAVRDKDILPEKGRGRPRIYSDEERKEKAREKAKDKYYKKMGYTRGNRPKKDTLAKDPRYDMLNSSRTRARAKGLLHNIDIEDIVIPEVCPILGVPLVKGVGDYSDNSPTLDRIIPKLGYTKGNVWVISMRANRLKQDSTLEELELLYLKVKERICTL
jgi:hypothetical protein